MLGSPAAAPPTAELLDRFHDQCGVLAVIGVADAGMMVRRFLPMVQHRGPGGCGIITNPGGRLAPPLKGLGFPSEAFPEATFDHSQFCGGRLALGHTRYGTVGPGGLKMLHPFCDVDSAPRMGAAFNGTLLNVDEIHGFLPDGTFETSADTECFVRLYQSTAATRDPFERVREVLRVTSGAFSVGFAFDDRIIVARDPRGFRPLYFARLRQGGYAVASESHVLERMGARGGVSEVLPGEAIEFQVTGGMRREIYAESPGRSSCLFELIYFASVLGVLSGVNVGHYRHHVGRYLAHKEVSERDLHNLKSFASESSIVIPVLNSGAGYASSYAAQLGLSVGTGLVRDGDVRAFLGANAEERKQLLSRKHGLIPYIYDAKTEIIIVDDSLVRSDTMRHIVALVREVYRNARVHVRIATPEVIGPCFFGIATPQASQLIAARLKTDQIRDEIGADSLVYLDYGDLYRAYLDCRRAEGKEAPPDQVFNFCDGCFTGRYPMAIPPDSGLRQAPPTFPLPVL